jgi:hypothetical protein
MPPVADLGPLSNRVSVENKRVSGPLDAAKKRKLENFEPRLGDETRAFRPEIPESYEPSLRSHRVHEIFVT